MSDIVERLNGWTGDAWTAITMEEAAATILSLRQQVEKARAEGNRLKTALTMQPIAARMEELPDFMVALSEWGCVEPAEQAEAIRDFLASSKDLSEYRVESRALKSGEGV